MAAPRALLALTVLLFACTEGATDPPPPPPPPPTQGADPGPFAPEPPATVAEIRANPALRAQWRAYCDEIEGMAFILIYPPPPGAERIGADAQRCRQIFS